MKKIICILLSALMLPCPAAGAAEPAMSGIDVSRYQGEIDWEKTAEEIGFAVIRCGYGSDIESQDDPFWEDNARACEELGIPYGAYLYSYADTVEKAESEANHALRLLEGHTLTFPVYYDIEDSIQDKLTPKELAEIAKTFCAVIQAAGYEAGIYADKNHWETRLTDPAFDDPSWYKWVAQYSDECTYKGEYTMWQYSGSASVSGVEGDVDGDLWYGDVRKAKPCPVFTADISGGGAVITNTSAYARKASVIIAEYEADGTFKGSRIVERTFSPGEAYEVKLNNDESRVFVWDSVEAMTPAERKD